MGTTAAVVLTILILVPDIILVAGKRMRWQLLRRHPVYRTIWLLMLVAIVGYWCLRLATGTPDPIVS